jgi:uncharacterized protein (TIGR02598 family)
VNGTTPQVASEREGPCRRTRCFSIRVPASNLSGTRLLRQRGRSVRWDAFTLVEVVIAVGLVAFVLTAILGLAAMAANETKNADLKARFAWITERVTSEYQSQRFSIALGSVPTNAPATSYWDYSGTPTNITGAYFQCDVTRATPSPASTNFTTNNFALLQVSIRWPHPQLTSSNVSVISLFNYQ